MYSEFKAIVHKNNKFTLVVTGKTSSEATISKTITYSQIFVFLRKHMVLSYTNESGRYSSLRMLALIKSC